MKTETGARIGEAAATAIVWSLYGLALCWPVGMILDLNSHRGDTFTFILVTVGFFFGGALGFWTVINRSGEALNDPPEK